ncbi:MAG: type VI secretion system-associated FHA domain protein TagH [Methylococcales bacterium]|nr:type VI secretion system-associated FHA domain protein TagH [Methylococcales bacterium]
MSLILKVLSFKNQIVTEIEPVFIGNDGGSIGRSDDNALVLPDTEKFVSRHHATISFANGGYYLSDTSLSGVYLSNRETPLHNATERIENGMILKVGEYEIAVAISGDSGIDGFSGIFDSITPEPQEFLSVDEPWLESENLGSNKLMTDNFPSHEELVQSKTGEQHHASFESRLQGNHSPLFDSYIAPDIVPASPASADEVIPENFSFDDFFSASDDKPGNYSQPAEKINKPAVDDDFEDFFGAAIGDMAAKDEQFIASSKTPKEDICGPDEIDAILASNKLMVEPPLSPGFAQAADSSLFSDSSAADNELNQSADISVNKESVIEQPPYSSPQKTAAIIPISKTFAERNIEASVEALDDEGCKSLAMETPFSASAGKPADICRETGAGSEDSKNKAEPANGWAGDRQANLADGNLLNAFLQGAALENSEIRPEQQTETLRRIGQMFRKLIDGTMAVLRSRAEFKSLCRVNMTVIKAANNNPLKFTVSTDDVLRQLIENKTEGFLASTLAIEEGFNDIMNHQIAMQAGIQASLTELLKTFDPQIIEKQFEQGIVLQKKSKCWDRYEEVYRNTVEDAVENFFGEAFVKAYEEQMSLLTKSRERDKMDS